MHISHLDQVRAFFFLSHLDFFFEGERDIRECAQVEPIWVSSLEEEKVSFRLDAATESQICGQYFFFTNLIAICRLYFILFYIILLKNPLIHFIRKNWKI